MQSDERVRRLLDRWADLRHRGEAITLDELCRDCPDLLPLIRQAITMRSDTAAHQPAEAAGEELPTPTGLGVPGGAHDPRREGIGGPHAPPGRLTGNDKRPRGNVVAVSTILVILGAVAVGVVRLIRGMESDLSAKTHELARIEADLAKTRTSFEKAEKTLLSAKAALSRAERDREKTGGLLGSLQLRTVDRFFRTNPEVRDLLDDPEVFPIDERDFAWRFYHQAGTREIWRSPAGSRVAFAALAPSGDRVALFRPWTLTHPGSIDIVDRKGRTFHSIPIRNVSALAFSPDGARLAAGGMVLDARKMPAGRSEIRVWDGRTGKESKSLDSPPGNIYDVAFSTDGTVLASAGYGKVTVRSGETYETRFEWDLFGAQSLTMSPDGRWIAFRSIDKGKNLRTIEVRSLLTGARTASIPVRDQFLGNFEFGPDSRTLVVSDPIGPMDSILQSWKLAREPEWRLASTNGVPHRVTALSWSPDGKLLATGDALGKVRFVNLASGMPVTTFQVGTRAVRHLEYNRAGDILLTLSDHAALWRTADTGCKIVSMAPFGLSGLAFSPDGRFLATAGADRVRILDATGGKVLQEMVIPGGVQSIAVHPDGKRLAVETPRGLELWHLDRKERLAVLVEDRKQGRFLVEFDPDGKLLLSKGEEAAYVWDVDRQVLVKTFRPSDSPLSPGGIPIHGVETMQHVRFHPKRNWIVGTSDRYLYVWDSATGEQLHRIADLTGPLAFSPNGEHCLVGKVDREVLVLDGTTFEPTKERLAGEGVRGLAFLPNGRSFLTGGVDRVDLWDFPGLRKRGTLPVPARDPAVRLVIGHLAVHPSGERVAASWAKEILLWEAPRPIRLATFDGPNPTLDPTGRLLIDGSGPDGNGIRVRRFPSGRTERVLYLDDPLFEGDRFRIPIPTAVTPDGAELIAGGLSGRLHFWKTDTWKREEPLDGGDGKVVALALARDGSTLFSVTVIPDRGKTESLISIWNLPERKKTGSFPVQSRLVSKIVLSPDGRTLAVPDERISTIDLWDVPTRTMRHTIRCKWALEDLAFTRDGSFLISCSRLLKPKMAEYKSIQYWDTRSGEVLENPRPPTFQATRVGVHPDGNHLLFSTRDGTTVWNTSEAKEVATFSQVTGPYRFSPDGRFLLAAGTMYDFEGLWAEAGTDAPEAGRPLR